jgi:hypothetical protein
VVDVRQELLAILSKEEDVRASKEEDIEAYAIAGIKDHQSDQPFYVGETYVLQAGIRSNVSDGFEGVPISLPAQEEPIQIDIVVHADMVIQPNWIQTYSYSRSEEHQLLDFMLTPTASGHKEIRVEFVYGLHWLTKVQLEVEVIER